MSDDNDDFDDDMGDWEEAPLWDPEKPEKLREDGREAGRRWAPKASFVQLYAVNRLWFDGPIRVEELPPLAIDHDDAKLIARAAGHGPDWEEFWTGQVEVPLDRLTTAFLDGFLDPVVCRYEALLDERYPSGHPDATLAQATTSHECPPMLPNVTPPKTPKARAAERAKERRKKRKAG